MNADPDKALPMIKQHARRHRRRRSCATAPCSSSRRAARPRRARSLVDIAKSNPNPELQKHAIRNLGLFGGHESRQTLSESTRRSQSIEARRAVLAGADALAATESRLSRPRARKPRRSSAARPSSSSACRAAAKSSGRSTRQEKDVRYGKCRSSTRCSSAAAPISWASWPRRKPIPRCGATPSRSSGSPGRRSAPLLKNIYATDKDPAVKRTVLNAFFVQGNAKALIEIARHEQDQR